MQSSERRSILYFWIKLNVGHGLPERCTKNKLNIWLYSVISDLVSAATDSPVPSACFKFCPARFTFKIEIRMNCKRSTMIYWPAIPKCKIQNSSNSDYLPFLHTGELCTYLLHAGVSTEHSPCVLASTIIWNERWFMLHKCNVIEYSRLIDKYAHCAAHIFYERISSLLLNVGSTIRLWAVVMNDVRFRNISACRLWRLYPPSGSLCCAWLLNCRNCVFALRIHNYFDGFGVGSVISPEHERNIGASPQRRDLHRESSRTQPTNAISQLKIYLYCILIYDIDKKGRQVHKVLLSITSEYSS